MFRRSFLGVLGGLPLLGFMKPKPTYAERFGAAVDAYGEHIRNEPRTITIRCAFTGEETAILYHPGQGMMVFYQNGSSCHLPHSESGVYSF
jgi:hypothetical protein